MKAILFDLDDTLYDYAPAHKKGLDAVYSIISKKIKISKKKFLALYKISNDEIKNEYDDAERRYRIENDRLTKSQVSFEVSQNMVTAFQNNVKEYERRQKEFSYWYISNKFFSFISILSILHSGSY